LQNADRQTEKVQTNRAGMAERVSGAPPLEVTSGVDFSSPANDMNAGCQWLQECEGQR
jgi:hypothetical protein